MSANKIRRAVMAIVSAATIAFTGLGGFATAETSISNTGPDSLNSIVMSSSAVCNLINNNNITAVNSTNQNASSGNVSVSGNTNAGYPSDWGEWDPAVWAAHGYSYDEWHTQFMAHLQTNQSYMREHWSSLSSASASSGNASNNSSINTSVRINNTTPNCGGASTPGSGGGTIDHTGPDSGNTIVLGSSTSNTNRNFTTVSGATTTGQNAASGSSFVKANTSGGGSGSGNAGNSGSNGSSTTVNNPGSGGNGDGGEPQDTSASISNTGPDSDNSIVFSNTDETTVTNTNVINVATTNYQTATSGDASVNHNTNAGGANSGDASNSSDASSTVTISN